MRTTAHRGGTAGFTLIEVMVALAILGTALFVLLEAHYGAMRLFTSAKEEVEVNDLMERALGIAEGEALAGSTGGHGEFGKRYPDFAYTYQVDDLSGPDQPGFYAITVSIEGPDVTRELKLLVYRTAP